MGKRKRRPHHNNTQIPPFDEIPHSSQLDYFSEQKYSHQAYDYEARPSSSNMDSIDDPIQVSRAQPLPSHQHPNCSRGIVLKHPRHHYSRHYSRKRRSNRGETSNFTGKVTHQQGEKLSFRLSSKPHPDTSGRITENRERLFWQPEKIRDNIFIKDGSSSEMVCGLCEKLLRKKPYVFDQSSSSSSSSSGELSVVAVLVCGHVYHADCLEQGTCHEDRQDPPCPLCTCLLRDKDVSVVHE